LRALTFSELRYRHFRPTFFLFFVRHLSPCHEVTCTRNPIFFFSFNSKQNKKKKNNSTQKHLSVLSVAATVIIIQGERRNETKRREQLSG
jgi:hypothetical protein